MTESIAQAYRRHEAGYDRLFDIVSNGTAIEWSSAGSTYTVRTDADGKFVGVFICEQNGHRDDCVGVDYEDLPTLIDALMRAKAHLDQPATTPVPPVPQPGANPNTPPPTGAGR